MYALLLALFCATTAVEGQMKQSPPEKAIVHPYECNINNMPNVDGYKVEVYKYGQWQVMIDSRSDKSSFPQKWLKPDGKQDDDSYELKGTFPVRYRTYNANGDSSPADLSSITVGSPVTTNADYKLQYRFLNAKPTLLYVSCCTKLPDRNGSSYSYHENGSPFVDNPIPFGSIARINLAGYVLERTCEDNAIWSEDIVVEKPCLSKCKVLDQAPGLEVTYQPAIEAGKFAPSGNRASMLCKDGYGFTDVLHSDPICAGGKWVPEPAACIKTLQMPPGELPPLLTDE